MTIVKGFNAIEKLNETNEKKENALKWLKAGESKVVCIPSTDEVAQVFQHGVFGVFNSCQCTKEDLFDQAVDKLYELANAESNEGKPLLIDCSKKQGQGLYGIINEYADELGSYAFKLSKADGGVMSLTPILKGLTAEQKANFEACKGKELDGSLYENAIFKRDIAGQKEDLKKFGFDLSLIMDVATEVGGQIEEDEMPF